MRTVTFKQVLNGISQKLGMDPTRDLNAARAASLTEYVNLRVAEGWKFDFFPEWTVVEQRYFRDAYSAAENVVAADQKFFIGSGLYYQALRAQSPAAQAPATLTDGEWEENSAYWAVLASSYDAEDWETGTVFAVGDQTREPLTGLFYQCHTAHTAGGTFDSTKFGVLTAFDRYVAYEQTSKTKIGTVKQVSRRNPRIFPSTLGKVTFAPSANGVQITDPTAPNIVWVEFRLRPPVFDRTLYSASANVAVNDIRYYPTTGECYKALQAQSPATQAPTVAAYWVKVDFPEILEDFVKRAVFCDALTDQKQQSRKLAEIEDARDRLADLADEELAAQGQFDRAAVETYGA